MPAVVVVGLWLAFGYDLGRVWTAPNPRSASCDGTLLPSAGRYAWAWLVPTMHAVATCAVVLLLRRQIVDGRLRSWSFALTLLLLPLLLFLQYIAMVRAGTELAGLLPVARVCSG